MGVPSSIDGPSARFEILFSLEELMGARRGPADDLLRSSGRAAGGLAELPALPTRDLLGDQAGGRTDHE